ncbi:ribosomal protein S7e [Artemisia annua]|uniref:40S ribosomal protein S7 n=1 Tax=Artemisia annua TaxID=35608 RepID=A0A2U1N3J8_ARTAN|nr:ribosomal protein S7e [Artemisia annua]
MGSKPWLQPAPSYHPLESYWDTEDDAPLLLLYLNPVHTVVQLRPSMKHLQNLSKKSNTARDEEEQAIKQNSKKQLTNSNPKVHLEAVHDAMLEDVCHPAEIVGKRVRYRLDGSKIIKIYLDPKARNDTEYKLETFSGVYRKLSGKDVVFEYPMTEA